MFCSKCGQSVSDGAIFCVHCGSPLSSVAQPPQPSETPGVGWPLPPTYTVPPNYPSQGYYPPPQQGYGEVPVQKKKTGLVVGLIVGIVALLGIAAVLLFVWPGFLNTAAPVKGEWYSENRGEVIRFGAGGSFDAYTPYGDFEGDYQYDQAKGEGHIEMSDGREFDFAVDKDTLYVYDMGAFTRADKNFDLDDFVDDASDEFGENNAVG